ncbi:MAG TPA: SDR family NAD(P)-dependent oxidoreductase, partial [Burkholderiales bacterium]|nr:SDR family NAD(P)-dependent oxidoreductase [Burkholderiales bacterium]
MGLLTGRTALVAGAGRNNGKAISIAFAREGADLILVARERKDSLNEVVKECEQLGAKVLPIMADVSDHEQVERLVQQGLDRYGQI